MKSQDINSQQAASSDDTPSHDNNTFNIYSILSSLEEIEIEMEEELENHSRKLKLKGKRNSKIILHQHRAGMFMQKMNSRPSMNWMKLWEIFASLPFVYYMT